MDDDQPTRPRCGAGTGPEPVVARVPLERCRVGGARGTSWRAATRFASLTSMTLLVGARMRLRDFDRADLDAVHSFAGDAAVTRYTDFGPNTREESQQFLSSAVAQAGQAERTEFTLAAELTGSGRLVGSVGIQVTSVAHRRGSLGFVFHPSCWSQGYATEAALMLVRFGRDELDLHRIEATCHPDNHASARVLEKIGMQREGRLRDHLLVRGSWRDSLVYAALNEPC